MTAAPLLVVENLSVHHPCNRGMVRAVDQVSFTLDRGRTLALVGESGCGKSTLCRALLGLLPQRSEGRIMFAGCDLGRLQLKERDRLCGQEIGIVLQNHMSSLNPVMTIGWQLAEPMRHHLGITRSEARGRCLDLLIAVGIPRPDERIDSYPHQLSGGMRQRVAIALALACEPRLLIADEATTALDVTVQAEILNLLGRLQAERGMAMILVTHDLGVVAGRAHETAVMYAGRIVEQAPTAELFARMRMPYTKALFESIPRLDDPPHKVLKAIDGHPPDLAVPQAGCSFAPRCSRRQERCRKEEPPLAAAELKDHRYACWFPCNGENPR